MKNAILLAFALAGFGVTAFPDEQRIAFERNDAVYIANLDGTCEKKIAEGVFPALRELRAPARRGTGILPVWQPGVSPG